MNKGSIEKSLHNVFKSLKAWFLLPEIDGTNDHMSSTYFDSFAKIRWNRSRYRLLRQLSGSFHYAFNVVCSVQIEERILQSSQWHCWSAILLHEVVKISLRFQNFHQLFIQWLVIHFNFRLEFLNFQGAFLGLFCTLPETVCERLLFDKESLQCLKSLNFRVALISIFNWPLFSRLVKKVCIYRIWTWYGICWVINQKWLKI